MPPSFSRLYPYEHIHPHNTSLKDVLIHIGKGLEEGRLTQKEVVDFLSSAKLVFLNTKTNMDSAWFWEQEDSHERAYFHCIRSCSCECGPLSEPCNEQGPDSKIEFSFKKEEK